MPRSEQVPRPVARAWSHETVAILEAGEYRVGEQHVVFRDDLAAAVAGTRSYPPNAAVAGWHGVAEGCEISVVNDTTLASGLRLGQAGFNPVALNFASATSPGGGS